jgi:hypothetical protein
MKVKGRVENSTVSITQSAWRGGAISQDGVVSSGLSVDSKAEVKQLAVGGVVTQKGVVSSGLSVDSKAEVKQLAIGGVVSQDPVSQ